MILRCHFLLLSVILHQSKSLLISTDSSANHFPEDGPLSAEENESSSEIPIELLDEINEVSNITDFLTRFVVNGTAFANEENVERNAAIEAVNAECEPVDEIVTLEPEGRYSTSVMYYPICTRVKRCSGCCTNYLRKCEAVESEDLTFKITAYKHNNNYTFERQGYQFLVRKQHKSCKCRCRVKEADCNRFQKYDPIKCQCNCLNIDDEKKCTQSTHIWDSQRCACQCRNTFECTTTTYFDSITCQCTKALPTGQGGSSLVPIQIADRQKFIIKAVTVSPNQEYETVN